MTVAIVMRFCEGREQREVPPLVLFFSVPGMGTVAVAVDLGCGMVP